MDKWPSEKDGSSKEPATYKEEEKKKIMAFRLDDIINRRKETTAILDLSRCKLSTREEFERAFEKVPEYRIKPEKVRPEDARVRDNEFSFASRSRTTTRTGSPEFPFPDPVPSSMREVRLEDLSAVDINWRMLTMARPKTKLDEEVFSRLVDLGKLRLKTCQREQAAAAAAIAAAAAAEKSGKAASAAGGSKGSGGKGAKSAPKPDARAACRECGEEFCLGSLCKEFPYDSYARAPAEGEEEDGDKKKKAQGLSKRRKRKRRKKKKGSKGKSRPQTGVVVS